MKKLIEALKEKLGDEIFTEAVQTELETSIDVMIQEAVNEKVKTKEAELEEQTLKNLDEFKNEMLEQLDKYLDYAASEYFEENKVVIEQNMSIAAATHILEKVKAVFNVAGFEIPESDRNIVTEMETKISDFEEKLNYLTEDNISLKDELLASKQKNIFIEKTAGMTESKVSQIQELVESLSFKNEEDYTKKLDFVISKIGTITEEKETIIEDPNLVINENNKRSIDKYL